MAGLALKIGLAIGVTWVWMRGKGRVLGTRYEDPSEKEGWARPSRYLWLKLGLKYRGRCLRSMAVGNAEKSVLLEIPCYLLHLIRAVTQ